MKIWTLLLVNGLLFPLPVLAQEMTEAKVRGNGVLLLSEPVAGAEVVAVLERGDTIRITGDATNEAGEARPVSVATLGISEDWYVPVEAVETGLVGWIAELYIDPRSLNVTDRATRSQTPSEAISPSATQVASTRTPASTGTLAEANNTEPLSQDQFLAGQVPGGLPTGADGEVSVVKRGQIDSLDGVEILIVAYNGTGQTVSDVEARVVVRSADGELLGTSSSTLTPRSLDAGSHGIGTVIVSAPDLPGDTTFDVSFDWEIGESAILPRIALAEVELLTDRIVGIATNLGGGSSIPLTFIDAMCFDASGTPTGSIIEPAELELSEPTTFQIDLYGEPCEGYLVAA